MTVKNKTFLLCHFFYLPALVALCFYWVIGSYHGKTHFNMNQRNDNDTILCLRYGSRSDYSLSVNLFIAVI